MGLAFDGTYIWVVNYGNNTVTRLKAKDGKGAKTFAVGKNPRALAFDGVHIWVANSGDDTVTKLMANDGANLGTFPAGDLPGA